MENDPFDVCHQGDRVPKLNRDEACTEYPATDVSQGQAEAEAVVNGAGVPRERSQQDFGVLRCQKSKTCENLGQGGERFEEGCTLVQGIVSMLKLASGRE